MQLGLSSPHLAVPPEPVNRPPPAPRFAPVSFADQAQLRRAGMWLLVDDDDDHVPPLLSSARKTKKVLAASDAPEARPPVDTTLGADP